MINDAALNVDSDNGGQQRQQQQEKSCYEGCVLRLALA